MPRARPRFVDGAWSSPRAGLTRHDASLADGALPLTGRVLHRRHQVRHAFGEVVVIPTRVDPPIRRPI